MMDSDTRPVLLIIPELGGYPDFGRLYEECGYHAREAAGLRKGLALIRQLRPAVVVTDFRYKPTYGTQISNLESLFAAMEKHCPASQLVVFYDRADAKHLDSIRDRFTNLVSLAFPIRLTDLRACLSADTKVANSSRSN